MARYTSTISALELVRNVKKIRAVCAARNWRVEFTRHTHDSQHFEVMTTPEGHDPIMGAIFGDTDRNGDSTNTASVTIHVDPWGDWDHKAYNEGHWDGTPFAN